MLVTSPRRDSIDEAVYFAEQIATHERQLLAVPAGMALTDAAAQSIVLLATRAGPLPAAVANFVEQAASGAQLVASPTPG